QHAAEARRVGGRARRAREGAFVRRSCSARRPLLLLSQRRAQRAARRLDGAAGFSSSREWRRDSRAPSRADVVAVTRRRVERHRPQHLTCDDARVAMIFDLIYPNGEHAYAVGYVGLQLRVDIVPRGPEACYGDLVEADFGGPPNFDTRVR